MKTKDYRAGLLERLQDPEYATAYLAAAQEDGNPGVLALAQQDVAEARRLSEEA